MPSTITDRLNGLTTSVAVKAPCRAATTAAITLSGEQTIDGVSVVSGDRVLVKNQSTATENGIYVANSGDWTRATDFDGSRDVVGGTQISVLSGTANAKTYWRVGGSDSSVAIGADSVSFEAAGLSDSAAHTFEQAGTNAKSRDMRSKGRERISDDDYDGDDEEPAQAALDYASSLTEGSRQVRDVVHLNAGNISSANPLVVPEGNRLIGSGALQASDRTGTTIVKSDDGDGVRVDGRLNGSVRYWYGELGHFGVYGTSSLTSGWGVNFADASGNAITPQDTTHVHDIVVRGMPDGGLQFPAGGLPLHVERANFLFNDGPGLFIQCAAFSQQSIHLQEISGDGNNGGLIQIDDADQYSNIRITNFKSEFRENADYADAEHQSNAIVINDASGSAYFRIDGGTHISSVPDGVNFKKPGDAIKIAAGAGVPHVEWNNVKVRVRGTDTGTDPNVLSHTSASVAIPYTVPSGKLSNFNEVWRTTVSDVRYSFGNVDTYQNRSVESPCEQIAGATPGRSLHVTAGTANEKTWLEVASGSQLSRRAVNDSGTGAQFERISRSGNTVTEEAHKRIVQILGTTHVTGDYTLHANWGDTAAVTVNGASKDTRFDISVACAGTGIGANPTITLTFKDGAFPNAPMGVVNGWNETDSSAIALKWAESTTTLTITFLGTPVTGKTYRIKGVLA